VPGLHFYTFNRAKAPMEILASLRGRQLLTA
jgi:5,10-methylenetetrahydrofolate reductase